MGIKKEYSTVSVDTETKAAIKNLSIFTKTPLSSIIRDLLVKHSLLDNDGSNNTFANWNEETLIRYKRFLQLRDEK